MREKRLRVIVLTHGNAIRLLELLSGLEVISVAGVFVETRTQPKRNLKQKIKRSIRYDGFLETFKKLKAKIFRRKTSSAKESNNIEKTRNQLEKYVNELKIPFHKVENYHNQEVIDLLKKTKADLGILYGTNIVKESVFNIPRLGSINLHQGLAPLYRGGPTVFWELFNDEKEIGITIHFVAAKVDTGDIILQKKLPLEYNFSRFGYDYESFIEEFRYSLKEPSVQMIVEAVKLIAEGREKRIKQDISIGKRYRLPTKKEKDALLKTLKERFPADTPKTLVKGYLKTQSRR